MKMTGNSILITGGASGLGLEMARAFLALGNRQESRKPHRDEESEFGLVKLLPSRPPPPESIEVPVCPVGTLSRLKPHQAYILFADG